jgi:hypothetical protein
MLIVTYAECRIEAPSAECRFDERRYFKCHYADCCGAVSKAFKRVNFGLQYHNTLIERQYL